MQVPGREQHEPGASAVLCQRLSGVQRSQVGCCLLSSHLLIKKALHKQSPFITLTPGVHTFLNVNEA